VREKCGFICESIFGIPTLEIKMYLPTVKVSTKTYQNPTISFCGKWEGSDLVVHISKAQGIGNRKIAELSINKTQYGTR